MVYHDPKSLSQNFIKSRNLVAELLDTTSVDRDDLVLEIGPGKGIITEQLVNRAGKIIAVEKDQVLFEKLKEKFAGEKNIVFFNEDILDFCLPRKPYKVVSNIPFSITAKIINKLTMENMPSEMYLIMQLEAAEKFVGKNGETMSSMLTKPWYEIEILGEIDRTSFTLKPQIKIVFVKFIKRERPFVVDEIKSRYRNFITFGFSQWQPTVSLAFKKIMTFTQRKQFEKVFQIDKLKPGQLSFDNWLLMFKSFVKIANEDQIRRLRLDTKMKR